MLSPKTNHLKRWHLSTRLILATIGIFAVVFALSVASHLQNRADRKEARLEDMQQVSRTIAAVFEGFAADLESFSLSTSITLGDANVSTDPADSERLQPSIGPFLQHLFESYGVLRAIFVTNPDGIVVLSNADTNGADLSDRGYIQALRRGATDYWSVAFPGAQSGITTIAYSRRIVNLAGETTGFLVVAFYPSELAERLPANLPGDGHVTLVDRNGSVLLTLPDAGEPAPEEQFAEWPDLVRQAPAGEVLANAESVPLAVGDSHASLVGIDRLGWVVGYSLPSEAIEGQANSLFLRDMTVMGTALLLGLVMMIIIANRLARPLSRLTDAASAIARGESIAEVQSSDADVAVLASTMNQMRLAIEAREHELRVQTSVMESVERMGESLAQELDLERVIEAIADCGLDLTGAEAAIFLQPELALAPGVSEPTKARRRLVLPAASTLVGQVLGGHVVIAQNAAAEANRDDAQDSSSRDEDATAQSVLGIPVQSRRGVIAGGLFLLHSRPEAFTSQHRRLAMALARWSGIVLENAKLYSQSQELLSEVQRASQDKDEFLAVVSHELRTPITTIYGGTRLMHIRRDQLTEQAMNDMIASVAEEAEHLYRMVEDLLAIARTEMSEGIEREPVSIAAVVEQAVDQLQRRRSREVEARIPEDVPPALAEPSYLGHILYNLISNADKYSPEGQPIEVDVEHANSEIVLRVLDHGPGVPDEQLDQIFESFYRTRAATERASGKGLGLTVCKRLVEALSGRIFAKNRPGGGLEVSVVLEVAEEDTEVEFSANGDSI